MTAKLLLWLAPAAYPPVVSLLAAKRKNRGSTDDEDSDEAPGPDRAAQEENSILVSLPTITVITGSTSSISTMRYVTDWLLVLTLDGPSIGEGLGRRAGRDRGLRAAARAEHQEARG